MARKDDDDAGAADSAPAAAGDAATAATVAGPSDDDAWTWSPGRIAKVVSFLVLFPGSVWWASGDPHGWPRFWLVFCLQLAAGGLALVRIRADNPTLVRERERMLSNPGVAPFDRALLPHVLWMTGAFYYVAALEHRARLARAGPGGAGAAEGAGLADGPGGRAGFAASLALMLFSMGWEYGAMVTNRWFSSVVRLQTDRGHRVCDRGPYSIVRHPGYLGFLLQPIAEALLLRSWWAGALGAARGAVLVARTAKEDAFLHRHLPGYPAYAARVRWRLLPLVW